MGWRCALDQGASDEGVGAGATGAIGKQLVPRLAAAGHGLHGMTHSEAKQAMRDELGAVPVVADALDPEQVAEAVARAKPEVIVHHLTAIGSVDLRHMDHDFALAGDGVWSLIPTADGAEATVAAVNHGGRGVYNIVDDDPAPVKEWLPALARTLGAKQPTGAPRLAAGEAGAVLMTQLGGAANAKATRALGWQPRHPSWRRGLAT
jgi:nucleoside-diphosphate-sugar epimerase